MECKSEQFYPVLVITLYKTVSTLESVDEIRKRYHSNESNEQYFPVVLFIMLYKVILNFEAVDEITKGHHSNESHGGVLCCVLRQTR